MGDAHRHEGLVEEPEPAVQDPQPDHRARDSGHEGRQVEYTRDFAERLGKATGLPVEFRDERLTTVQAERVLREGGVHLREDRARSVDMLSAVLLLQDYLDSRTL